MYIIIIGGGKVGYYLAKALLNEGHEILVVEKNADRSEFICNELGSVCTRGDGCDDEDNLVACQVAKHKFNVPRTIARTSNPKNETIFKKLGIDVTISSTNIILEYIEEEVPTHPLTHLLSIRDKGLEIVEVKIPPESPTVGKRIKELPLPKGSILSLIIRSQHKPIVPNANTILQAEDQIIAVTTPESEDALRIAVTGF